MSAQNALVNALARIGNAPTSGGGYGIYSLHRVSLRCYLALYRRGILSEISLAAIRVHHFLNGEKKAVFFPSFLGPFLHRFAQRVDSMRSFIYWDVERNKRKKGKISVFSSVVLKGEKMEQRTAGSLIAFIMRPPEGWRFLLYWPLKPFVFSV